MLSTLDRTVLELAIGRILSMGSRPAQPGDAADYARCRGIILDILGDTPDHRPSYARDRMAGATGGD